MPTEYKTPIAFDAARCEYSALSGNDKLPPENIPVSDLLSSDECNLLHTDNSGLLELCGADLVSTIDGGNVIGVNPDDGKLYINPCLIPGPQNIVSNKPDNIIQKDPDDCSAYLSAIQVTEEVFSTGDERGYYGPGLVYVENQDGSHQLRAAICRGLTTNNATLTDGAGNVHEVRAVEINLDPAQNILYFAENLDECQDCLSACDTLSIGFSLNASGNKLRILDHGGDVYSQINLSNGLQGDGSGGLTINTLDTYTDGTSDLPVSEKALKSLRDSLAVVARTGNYNDLLNKPNLHAVATSGDYNDLINKPTIPSLAGEVADGETRGVTGDKIFDYIQSILGGGGEDSSGALGAYISWTLAKPTDNSKSGNYTNGVDWVGINQTLAKSSAEHSLLTFSSRLPNNGLYLVLEKWPDQSVETAGQEHWRYILYEGGSYIVRAWNPLYEASNEFYGITYIAFLIAKTGLHWCGAYRYPIVRTNTINGAMQVEPENMDSGGQTIYYGPESPSWSSQYPHYGVRVYTDSNGNSTYQAWFGDYSGSNPVSSGSCSSYENLKSALRAVGYSLGPVQTSTGTPWSPSVTHTYSLAKIYS